MLKKRHRGDVDRLRVCVIGAGMSGLITVKELLDENHAVVCYEKQSAEGGIFNLEDRVGNTAYESTLLTISNYAMAFSCLPPLEHEERRFWTVKEYQRYLARFVDHYGLRDVIEFGAEVTSVERFKDNLWLVRSRVRGEERVEVFDAIAVCSGAFQKAKYPELPFVGGDDSEVEIVHSIEYVNPEPYWGKRVLCIGMAESGADIVHEISRVAEDTALSVRESPPPLIPRFDAEHVGALPTDSETTEHRYGAFLNQHLSRANKTRDERAWREARDRELAALPTEIDGETAAELGDRYARIEAIIAEWNRRSYAGGLPFVGRFLNKNTIFVSDIADGRLRVNFSGIERIDAKKVLFRDGREFETDVIMCCTGFQEEACPFLQDDPLLREHLGDDRNPRDWFKHMIHPQVGKSFAFIGWARPTQGMLPALSELQARYFALLCSNRRKLPDDLEARTRAENQAEAEMLKGDPKIRTLVHYPYFSDGLAELIGCAPRLSTRLKDPHLSYKLFFGSKLPYVFRLDGPHRDPKMAMRVLKKLRVADTLKGQITTGLANARPVYEAWAIASNLVADLKRRIRPDEPAADKAFHAWGPGQLRQTPPGEAKAPAPSARPTIEVSEAPARAAEAPRARANGHR